jgi:hypothetical protein
MGGVGFQRQQGFALGIDKRTFIPRHAPAPAHLRHLKIIIVGDQDWRKVGWPDVLAWQRTVNHNLVPQPDFFLVAFHGVTAAHGRKLPACFYNFNRSRWRQRGQKRKTAVSPSSSSNSVMNFRFTESHCRVCRVCFTVLHKVSRVCV